jgi:hypothetical protein
MQDRAEDDLAVANATVAPRDTHAELFDPGTHDVWLSREPVTREWYDALVPPEPLVKSGFGRGEMDRAWFLCSPGAVEHGALRTRTIGERLFQLVARPDLAGAVAVGTDGFPRRLAVDKCHVLVFAAGRSIPILTSAEGRHFLPLVAARRGGALDLPAGWRLHEIDLANDWQVELPAPTETWWFANGASFQGPVTAPPGAVRPRAPVDERASPARP